MRAYIIRRVLLVIPTLFILSTIVFLTVRFIPGDVIDALIANSDYMALDIDREFLEEELGLNVPLPVQYAKWMSGMVLHGTFGDSLMGNWKVEERIVGRLPVTIQLGIMAILIGLLISLPVGVYSAVRQDTASDYVGRTFAIAGLAMPNFWLGTLVMIFPALWWGWAPPLEMVRIHEDPIQSLYGFLIPSLILGTAMAAGTMRLTRTMMLEVLRQDYIRTARSKGLRERTVIIRHATKNALIPVITTIGLQLPLLVGGSVIIENIFNLPGLGQLALEALLNRDYPVVSGINMFFGATVVFINLIVDLLYPVLDPRVRYQ
ncbi:ABC transporter permease [Dehalococcoidia bacterium]|nr:ABC transporter permease [Dehalococcoidia bacterium]